MSNNLTMPASVFLLLLVPTLLCAQSGTITSAIGLDPASGVYRTEVTLRPQLRALTFDPAGNAFVISDNRVLKIDGQTGIVRPYAGIGRMGYSGDGGPAVQAEINNPASLAFDRTGNLLIVDVQNHRIRRVDARTGVITTIAGSGPGGGLTQGAFSGEGGRATEARLAFPNCVAADSAGDLFITDGGNMRIRRISAATGHISTLVGWDIITGFVHGCAHDGRDSLYVADGEQTLAGGVRVTSTRIVKVDTRTGRASVVAGSRTLGLMGFAGDGGPATSARYLWIGSLALAPGGGDLYFTDTSSINAELTGARIRKLSLASGTVATVAGGAEVVSRGDGEPAANGRFGRLEGISFDPQGNLYATDWNGTGVIRRLVQNRWEIFAGGGNPQSRSGSPLDTPLSGPEAITFDESAQPLFTHASGRGVLSRLDGKGIVQRVAEVNGGVAADPYGNIYVADFTRVYRWDRATGQLAPFAGSGRSGNSGRGRPALEAEFSNPSRVAADSNGRVYILDRGNHKVRLVDVSGTLRDIYGSQGGGIGIWGIALAPDDSLLINDAGAIIRYNPGTGEHKSIAGQLRAPGETGDGGLASDARIGFGDLAVDSAGNIFIAGNLSHTVRRIHAQTGIISRVAGDGTFGFAGDGGPATAARLAAPRGIAVDRQGDLWIADYANSRIRKVAGVGARASGGFDQDGAVATNVRTNRPGALATDSAGNIYYADRNNRRVRRIDGESRVVTTVAGSGSSGYGGNGGPATDASMAPPAAIAFDGEGALYIADAWNHCIRRVDSSGTIWTIAGNGKAGFTGDGGPAHEASLNSPSGVAVTEDGALWIADTRNHRIRRVDPVTGNIATVGGTGVPQWSGDGGRSSEAAFAEPHGMAVSPDGYLYIADTGNKCLRRIRLSDGLVETAAFDLLSPEHVAVGSDGRVFVSDRYSGTIKVRDGDTVTVFAERLMTPSGVAVLADGSVIFAESERHVIRSGPEVIAGR